MEIKLVAKKLGISEGLFEREYAKDNYRIEYDPQYKSRGNCAVYFSSSAVYYPNTDEKFIKGVVEEDKYEWLNTKVRGVYKHIFIRDIVKQFYVYGISSACPDMDSLTAFLRRETEGLKLMTLGCSSGGYAAAVIGSILGAETVFCFSGFFSLYHISADPWFLPDHLAGEQHYNKYYEVVPYLKNKTFKMFYFYPALSKDEINNDSFQCTLVKDCDNVYTFPMKTKEHGVAVAPYCVQDLVSMEPGELVRLHGGLKPGRPIPHESFALKVMGRRAVFFIAYQSVRRRLRAAYRSLLKKDD